MVKSQAGATLGSVLGPDAKLLLKIVQLLPFVLLTCTCLSGTGKHKKACFPALQLPPKPGSADAEREVAFCNGTVSCGDCSLHARIVVAGCCQTISSYAWLAVKILRDRLWRL